jgi:photosystem II stability/assembly factor-like uncharacterized protein
MACRRAFDPTDPNIIYASSGGRLKISRDRGKTFASIGNLRDPLGGEIAINPADPKIMLAGSRSGRCWLSRDAGATWAACQGPAGQVIAFHFDRTRQGGSMFAATDRGVWRSDVGGQTWQRIGREGPQTFGGYFHPKHDGWIYMTLTEDAPGAGLWLSRDGGQTWRAFDDLPFSNIQRVEFDPANDAVIRVTTFGDSVWRGPVAPSEP